METLYNSNGKPVAYLNDDNEHIYLYDGTPVGFVRDAFVYNYNGRYLGWIQNGWYYDRNGYPTFFTENATGGPTKPVKQIKPVRGVRQVRPVKGVREVRPARPARSLNWSDYFGIDYFKQ